MISGNPLCINMEEVGLPKGRLLIYFGETVKDMNRELRRTGIVTDDTEQTFHPGWNKDETNPLDGGHES